MSELYIQPRLLPDERVVEPNLTLITDHLIKPAFEIAGFDPLAIFTYSGTVPGALVLMPSSHNIGAPVAIADAIRAVHENTRVIIASQFPVPDSSYLVVSNWRIATAFHKNSYASMSDHLKSLRRQSGRDSDDERRYQLVVCSRLQPRVPGLNHPSSNSALETGILWFMNSILDRSFGVGIIEENIVNDRRDEIIYSVYSRLAKGPIRLQGVLKSYLTSH